MTSTDTTTEALYELVDAIEGHLTPQAQTPSALARKAGMSTSQAHEALRWMARENFAITEGNGAWTKYRTRRFGERNA